MIESRPSIVKDMRMLRAFSLIFLGLLTIVPSVVDTNVLGEFIPLSIGALIVLGKSFIYWKLPYPELHL